MSSVNSIIGRYGQIYAATGGGALTLLARVTQWVVNPKMATSSEWGDSDSGGYTNRAPGRIDCTFSCEGKFETSAQSVSLFAPGDIVTAELRAARSPYPLLAWNFPRALCTDYKLTVNIDSEEVESWTAEFGADGSFTRPPTGLAGGGFNFL